MESALDVCYPVVLFGFMSFVGSFGVGENHLQVAFSIWKR